MDATGCQIGYMDGVLNAATKITWLAAKLRAVKSGTQPYPCSSFWNGAPSLTYSAATPLGAPILCPTMVHMSTL
jgi:hypothetical protein